MPKFLIVALALVGAQTALARSPAVDLATFREHCVFNREILRTKVEEAPPIGVVRYVPTGALQALQTRFNLPLMLEAKAKVIEKKGATLNPSTGQWDFKHDDGSSAFSEKRATTTVYYNGEFGIVDGHHRATISTDMMAPTTPTRCLIDLSNLERHEYETRLRELNYAYWRDHLGNPVNPVDLGEMTSDPNLKLARLLRYRVDARADGDRVVIDEGNGPETAIALKVNRDIPFYEFEIADALRRAGVEFDDLRDAADLSVDELAYYLAILKVARDEHQSRLHKILLLDKPRRVSKLDLPHIVLDHVLNRDCREHLEPGGDD